jgi:hypothetical protein
MQWYGLSLTFPFFILYNPTKGTARHNDRIVAKGFIPEPKLVRQLIQDTNQVYF